MIQNRRIVGVVTHVLVKAKYRGTWDFLKNKKGKFYAVTYDCRKPDRTCHVMGMFPHRTQELELTAEAILAKNGSSGYTLIAFQADDWNRDFSPWKSSKLDSSFSGGAVQTLTYIQDSVIPQIKATHGIDCPIYLMGYSLAGLFSLWSAFQTDVFAGAASCSGSLWYPEFLSYVKENVVGKPSKKFYLSLGGKESHTKNLLMASIADRTQECVQLLREYHQVKYELNPGGHFADPGKRLAKAVEWLLTNT